MSKRTIILGTGPLAREVVAAMVRRGNGNFALLGAVSESRRERRGYTAALGCPVLGPLDELHRIIADLVPERIVVAQGGLGNVLPERLLAALVFAGVAVESGADVYERLTGKVAIESLTPEDFLFVRQLRPARSALRLARFSSVTAAALGLLLTSPLFLVAALAIKLDSRGPVFFVQERVGLGGRRFRLYKFRSMQNSAARSEWARDNDDRITRAGAWLRRFRLDEIPQFFNVLRGDMNLVGPRPHPVSSSELVTLISRNAPECGNEIPYYALRSIVRPGITGWAQVRYKYANGLDEEVEKLKYDLYYVKHYSAALDFQVLFETVKVVLGGRGRGAAGAGATAPCGALRLESPPVIDGRERGAGGVDGAHSGIASNVRPLAGGALRARASGTDPLRRIGS